MKKKKSVSLFSLWSLPKKPVYKDAFSLMYSLATMNHAYNNQNSLLANKPSKDISHQVHSGNLQHQEFGIP